MNKFFKYIWHILLCTDKPLRKYTPTSIHLECSCGYRTHGWNFQEEITILPDVSGK